jgi:hypothetical protein
MRSALVVALALAVVLGTGVGAPTLAALGDHETATFEVSAGAAGNGWEEVGGANAASLGTPGPDSEPGPGLLTLAGDAGEPVNESEGAGGAPEADERDGTLAPDAAPNGSTGPGESPEGGGGNATDPDGPEPPEPTAPTPPSNGTDGAPGAESEQADESAEPTGESGEQTDSTEQTESGDADDPEPASSTGAEVPSASGDAGETPRGEPAEGPDGATEP